LIAELYHGTFKRTSQGETKIVNKSHSERKKKKKEKKKEKQTF